MADFKRLLDSLEIPDLFGLCRYPGDDFEGLSEITRGKANINLKPADVSHFCDLTMPASNIVLNIVA